MWYNYAFRWVASSREERRKRHLFRASCHKWLSVWNACFSIYTKTCAVHTLSFSLFFFIHSIQCSIIKRHISNMRRVKSLYFFPYATSYTQVIGSTRLCARAVVQMDSYFACVVRPPEVPCARKTSLLVQQTNFTSQRKHSKPAKLLVRCPIEQSLCQVHFFFSQLLLAYCFGPWKAPYRLVLLLITS